MFNRTCVKGSMSQGSRIFGDCAGLQCTAVAFIALLSAYTNTVSNWNENVLDDILVRGSSLYSTIIQQNFHGQYQYLAHSDLPTQYTDPNSNNMQTVLNLDIFYGVVGGVNDDASGSTALFDSFMEASQISPYIVFTANSLTVAVIVENESTIHLFDSHSRDLFGLPSDDGTAVLLSFASMEDLCMYLCSIYSNHQFNLTPVSIQQTTNQIRFLRNSNDNEENINTISSSGNLFSKNKTKVKSNVERKFSKQSKENETFMTEIKIKPYTSTKNKRIFKVKNLLSENVPYPTCPISNFKLQCPMEYELAPITSMNEKTENIEKRKANIAFQQKTESKSKETEIWLEVQKK